MKLYHGGGGGGKGNQYKRGGEDKIEDGEQFILFPVQNPPTCLLIPSRGIKIRSSPIKRINPVKDKIYVKDGMGGGWPRGWEGWSWSRERKELEKVKEKGEGTGGGQREGRGLEEVKERGEGTRGGGKRKVRELEKVMKRRD